MTSHGIAIGLHKGHRVTPLPKKIKASNRKKIQKRSYRKKLVNEVIREVAGYAPYEKRIMELLKNSLDKRALRAAKRKLGSHARAKNKREELQNVVRQESVLKAKKEKKEAEKREREKQ